jgi:hypothetical protein
LLGSFDVLNAVVKTSRDTVTRLDVPPLITFAYSMIITCNESAAGIGLPASSKIAVKCMPAGVIQNHPDQVDLHAPAPLIGDHA